MRIIGDVHGRIQDYLALTADAEGESIQIGDMGVGFRGVSLPPMAPGHRWFRGNHDSPKACRAHPNYLGDWGYDSENGTFWFGGADSIDRQFRTEGVSWWRDEELSISEFEKALELYEKVKPSVVLSHDGPQDFIQAGFGIHNRSRTRQALQAAYELWQPRLWVYGHHHLRREFESLEGTLFMCLPEIGLVDIDLPLTSSGDGTTTLGPFRTEETVEREFQEMLGRAAHAVKGVVDLPDRTATLLARLCLQNGCRLSARKRKKFSELTDEEVRRIEEAIQSVKQEATQG